MTVEIIGYEVEVDLQCSDCGYEWQEHYSGCHASLIRGRGLVIELVSETCPQCEEDQTRNPKPGETK